MGGVYCSIVTGILVRTFWVWPPQKVYPWQKSSSEVTEVSKTLAGMCCAFSWQSLENTTTTVISNSSHQRGH